MLMVHSVSANHIEVYRPWANHRLALKQEFWISFEFIKDTRWFNVEVDTGNNFVEINFKKAVMIRSFAYRAGLHGIMSANFE